MRHWSLPLLALTIAGCAPQSATLTSGEFTAFLAQSTSASFNLDAVDFASGEGTFYEADCRCTITVVTEADANCDRPQGGQCLTCAEFLDTNGDGEMDGGEYLDNAGFPGTCFGDTSDHPVYNFLNGQGEPRSGAYNPNPLGGDGAPQFAHETWFLRDSFAVYNEPLEPWRGEAIITSEGDFQVTFHHRLPGGSDFRFSFVLDPDFQPMNCVEDGAGVAEELQDGDWLDAWSTQAYERLDSSTDGTVYLLNAGSYQFDPDNLDDSATRLWSLPEDWAAGFAQAKFAEEDAFLRTTRYGSPWFYLEFEEDDFFTPSVDDLFYAEIPEGGDAATNPQFQSVLDRAQLYGEQTIEEWAAMGIDGYTPRLHTNEWRPADGQPAGLDGWAALHYNWVEFDSGSVIEAGGTASGTFNLIFDAAESGSAFFVRGTFETGTIRNDRWVTKNVQAIKLEENGTDLCGGTY